MQQPVDDTENHDTAAEDGNRPSNDAVMGSWS